MTSGRGQQAADLDAKLKSFLDLNPSRVSSDGTSVECEIRFGTRGVRAISRNDFNNVARKLLENGFVSDNRAGADLLRISSEYTDPRSARTKISNIRTEVRSLAGIQAYCKTNSLSGLAERMYGFTQKQTAQNSRGELMLPFNNDDFNFRVSTQTERVLSRTDRAVKELVQDWPNLKKQFRSLNRVTFTHGSYPVQVDLSMSRSNFRQAGKQGLEYTIESSRVFEGEPTFEVEIEFDNRKLGPGTPWTSENHREFATMTRVLIKLILAGLQETNYPIGYPVQDAVLAAYASLIAGGGEAVASRVTPKNFIGPSSVTLQMKNIAPLNADSLVPNIRNSYTVTDKADGTRKLLFVDSDGRIYLIDTTMRVQFTGALTRNEKLFKTLLDGEHILHNKRGDFINLFAAFDIYFLSGKDVRAEKFCPEDPEAAKTSYRFPMLVEVVKHLKAECVDPKLSSPIRVSNKKFYQGTDVQSIFVGCQTILATSRDGGFEYETDGLIFTPSFMGVGGGPDKKVGPLAKATWDYSFKWKPPQFNTIDFLVTTKKSTGGDDVVSNIYQEGTDAGSVQRLTQYKTLVLRCGFDERKHGFLNPCQSIIDDQLPDKDPSSSRDSYAPMPFYPTNPYDTNANICNLVVQRDGGGNLTMMTEEGDVFEDNTIVEFKYDPTKPEFWRWTPIRVRTDKTAELRQGHKNYGNAYHVANSNWHSIHNPITEGMLSTGNGVGDELADDDVYYSSSGPRSTSSTRAMRDFHNLFVKKILILSSTQPGDTLIDLAVGKGGDWPKWIKANLAFVFGLDISRDNIENRLDGACARFLSYRRQFRTVPAALFVQANSSVNVRSGAAAFTEKGKQITQAVFGNGPRDAGVLGQGVYKQYGKGRDGFSVSSCQFALHYFFESETTLHNFLRNLSECTAVGGYFIGTCYDGTKIFNQLAGKEVGESLTVMDKGRKIWEVTKEYSQTSFLTNRSSVGYPINVYQDSINKTFREWLVNFDYLKQVMENYGFVLAPEAEIGRFGLRSPAGMFSELFHLLESKAKTLKSGDKEYGNATKMSDDERSISFNNRYFIFKKVRDVDAQSLTNAALDISSSESTELAELAEQASDAVAAEKVKLVRKKPRGPPPVLRVKEEATGPPPPTTKRKVKRGAPKPLVLTENQKAAIASLKDAEQ